MKIFYNDGFVIKRLPSRRTQIIDNVRELLHKLWTLFKFLFWAAIIFIPLVYFTSKGLTQTEINQCRQWQKDVKQFNGFYLTLSQAKMCDSLGIKIITTVK